LCRRASFSLSCFFQRYFAPRYLHSFPTRRSSDLHVHADLLVYEKDAAKVRQGQSVRFTVESFPTKELEARIISVGKTFEKDPKRSEEHTSELQSRENLVCRLLLEKKKKR